jgi:hypothetical protein
LFCSCGAKKVAVSGKNLSARQIIQKHEEAAPDFKSLAGRIRAGYADEHTTQSISISIRMKKDSAIWLSAKLAGIIPLAKALITPEEVKYYEKINKTYFSGDFRLLSEWLGMELDFEKTQNLLVGQAIYPLDKEKYIMEKKGSGVQFESENERFLKKLFLLNPETFKTEAQQLVRESANQSMTVTYPEYEKFKNFYFPKEISIVAIHEKENMKIDIEYRDLEFDVPVSFPFEIPAGYEKIQL